VADAAAVQQLEVHAPGIAQFDDGRGGKAKTMALRMVENAPMARPATTLLFKSGRSRSFQSFNLTNTMALFCDLPENPMPEIVIQDSTASCSSSRK